MNNSISAGDGGITISNESEKTEIIKGFRTGVNAQDIPITIWSGTPTLYLFLTSEQTLNISSSSLLDESNGTGARTVYIEGLNSNYEIIHETINLNGLVPVLLKKQYFRINKAFVVTAGVLETNQGILTIRVDPAGTIVSTIEALEGESSQAIYTIPKGFRGTITDIWSTSGPAAASADSFRLRAREKGKAIRNSFPWLGLHSGEFDKVFKKEIKFKFNEKTDIFIQVTKQDSNNNDLYAGFDISLDRI